jgi:hypothetical protein
MKGVVEPNPTDPVCMNCGGLVVTQTAPLGAAKGTGPRAVSVHADDATPADEDCDRPPLGE